MMNPNTVNYCLDDLVDAFSGERILKFVHIPFQSGSDAVLMRMGRQYTISECEGIIMAFRKRYPDITIATDINCRFSERN